MKFESVKKCWMIQYSSPIVLRCCWVLSDRLAMESKVFLFGNVCKAAIIQREISLSMTSRIVKNICASFEVFYFRQIIVLLC